MTERKQGVNLGIFCGPSLFQFIPHRRLVERNALSPPAGLSMRESSPLGRLLGLVAAALASLLIVPP